MRMMCVMQFSSNICKPGGAHISLYRWGYQIDKEPVVQSIVSLTTSSRRQLTTLSNAMLFMPPTLKKWGAYWFRLVRSSVRSSGQNRIQGRVLKFHIWIPHQKIAYPYFFSCLNYLPLPSYAPFKA